MSGDRADWLVREVKDLLDVSDVGLYEFLWIQRGDNEKTADEELRRVATQALDRLVTSGDARLVWLKWPDPQHVDGPAIIKPGPRHWDDPGGDPYLAITRD